MNNLEITDGANSKSFVTLESKGTGKSVRQEFWVEAGRGHAIDPRVMVIATGVSQVMAEDNPDRDYHLIRYGYRK